MPIAALRSAATARAVVHLTNLLLLSFLEEEKPIRTISMLELAQPGSGEPVAKFLLASYSILRIFSSALVGVFIYT